VVFPLASSQDFLKTCTAFRRFLLFQPRTPRNLPASPKKWHGNKRNARRVRWIVIHTVDIGFCG